MNNLVQYEQCISKHINIFNYLKISLTLKSQYQLDYFLCLKICNK